MEKALFELKFEHEENNWGLPCRLRQVFQLLIGTILDGIFIRKTEEKLDSLGGEDVQNKIVSKAEGFDKNASEKLLSSICDLLFSNASRYLKMKFLAPEDSIDYEAKRFEIREDEDNITETLQDCCPMDMASYVNKKGGYKIFEGRVKL